MWAPTEAVGTEGAGARELRTAAAAPVSWLPMGKLREASLTGPECQAIAMYAQVAPACADFSLAPRAANTRERCARRMGLRTCSYFCPSLAGSHAERELEGVLHRPRLRARPKCTQVPRPKSHAAAKAASSPAGSHHLPAAVNTRSSSFTSPMQTTDDARQQSVAQ